MNNFLNVGLIQTTLHSSIAWPEHLPTLKMNGMESKRIWQEIKSGFINFKTLPWNKRPKIVLLPEFSLDDFGEYGITELSKSLGCVIIGGKDFITTISGGKTYVENKAAVIIPQDWPLDKSARYAYKFHFGKSFFSNEELEAFDNPLRKFVPKSSPHMYLLETGDYGKIGVAICADFFDIERFVIYKGRIHHLFIIAHNKDVQSFYFLSEAISRLVFCNVVICNTGFFGGSIAFSPYSKLYKRYIYKHEGRKLFTTQVVSLPVEELDLAQKKHDGVDGLYKSTPPAYSQK